MTQTGPAPAPSNLARNVDPEEAIPSLLADLRTQVEGLDEREAARRLQQVGPNEIRRDSGPRAWRSLLGQFTHPLALLLWMAAALSLITGVLAVAIAIVVVIALNAVFAFAQERQAEHATEALRSLLPPRARVRRDGALAEINATELVPGDLLLLAEGDRLSADARLTIGAVEVDMSPLTGESQPVTRSSERSEPAAAPLEAQDLIFAGTLCTGGDAQAIVYGTGMHTQLGRIAALSQTVVDESSPLQKQVNGAAKLIALVAVVLGLHSSSSVISSPASAWPMPAFSRSASSWPTSRRSAADDHPGARGGRATDGQATIAVQAPDRSRDARIDGCHLHRQDRNAHRGPDDGDLAVAGRFDPRHRRRRTGCERRGGRAVAHGRLLQQRDAHANHRGHMVAKWRSERKRAASRSRSAWDRRAEAAGRSR